MRGDEKFGQSVISDVVFFYFFSIWAVSISDFLPDSICFTQLVAAESVFSTEQIEERLLPVQTPVLSRTSAIRSDSCVAGTPLEVNPFRHGRFVWRHRLQVTHSVTHPSALCVLLLVSSVSPPSSLQLVSLISLLLYIFIIFHLAIPEAQQGFSLLFID